MEENRREKIIIDSKDIGSLEDVLGSNDPLFQPEPDLESSNSSVENKDKKEKG